MKKYRCTVCEWVYDPAVGDPDGGIAPGTPFEEIPDKAHPAGCALPFVTVGARTQAVSSE